MFFFVFRLKATFAEAHKDLVVIKRPDNPMARGLSHLYNFLQFATNILVKLLNIGLALSETFPARILHHIYHVVTFPIRVLGAVKNAIFFPLRVVFAPVRFVLSKLFAIPGRILSIVSSVCQFFFGTDLQPFPKLPPIEFIYGH